MSRQIMLTTMHALFPIMRCTDDVNSQLLEQETETCSHFKYMYCFELIPP